MGGLSGGGWGHQSLTPLPYHSYPPRISPLLALASLAKRVYRCSNLEIYSLRKCYEVEKRSGVYPKVHEHRIAEIVTFAAL